MDHKEWSKYLSILDYLFLRFFNVLSFLDRYNRPRDEGKYVHIPNPYIHIDNPYDGGYGPYTHQDDPYKWAETRDEYRLVVVPGDDNPYYKPGYYKNNGIKIISQEHNYDEDKYDFK